MLKTRQEEMKVAKELQNCFTDKIIPLFEILEDNYNVRYKIDPKTKAILYNDEGKKRKKIIEEPVDDDIITLKSINNIIGSKTAFIDYFRFTRKKYGNKIDIKKVKLSRRLNDDLNLYKERVQGITQYDNLIPVVSIKDGFYMPNNELKVFLEDLKKTSNKIALRLTDEFIAQYKEILEKVLEEGDFFLFDIQEQSPEVKFMELEEIGEMNIRAKSILLNSPRKAKIKNGDYPDNGYTNLINNCALDKTIEYSLKGYGDYCGLKDVLPNIGGSNGRGSAMALIYDYKKNAFWAYTNKDTNDGMSGYKKIIPLILKDRNRFDPQKECYGFQKIESLKGSGNWGTWNNICARRYISQVYENTKNS